MEEACYRNPRNGGKRRKINNNNKNGRHKQHEDRLSSLFDPLLVEILSLLPIQSAAATSVLSRRWRHLWTQVTSLRFSGYGKHLSAVDQILPQLTSPLIRALVIPYGGSDEDRLLSAIYSCFDHIRRRNDVEIIQVIDAETSSNIKIPAWVFQCQSLVSLDLCRYLNFELIDSNINLPNLKKISLELDYSARNLIRTLFTSCPLLEVLSVQFLSPRNLIDKSLINISAPNLKSLDIELCPGYPLRFEFVINAPKLFHLSIGDYYSSSHYSFVTIPSALVKAHLLLFPEGSVPTTQVSDLVRGITSVGSLELRDCSEMLNYLGCMDDGGLPIFHNLTLLEVELDEDYGCWKDLVLSLRCLPNLEVLRVSKCPVHEEDWNGLAYPPGHFLSKLKILEIDGLPLYEYDSHMLLLGYMLSNGNSLERLSVDVCRMAKQREVRLWKEYEFCETLFKLPRSSSNCEIEFNGDYIHASSHAFLDGFVACHSVWSAKALSDRKPGMSISVTKGA